MAPLKRKIKRVEDVFGVAPEVLVDSYVDRGDLDKKIARLLGKKKHIALRGVSKCGKSWLRQRVLPRALVVQCRLGKTVLDVYREALGELGIRLEVSSSKASSLTGTVEATAEVGVSLITKIAAKWGFSGTTTETQTTTAVRQDINDLGFIADLIRESGRILVIEDFHYLDHIERTKLAFDLKALWDFKTYVVIVGVWSGQNILVHLNPDLSARVREVPISWSKEELKKIFETGGAALNLRFGSEIVARAIEDCYGNAGILQRLIEGVLEEAGIEEEQVQPTDVDNIALLDDAELNYAEELNSVYLEFANRVSSGIRNRQNATGIYAHAMAVIMSANDEDLIRGVPLDTVFRTAHAREGRIQKGNLKTVLERIEALQVDDAGRGLVLAYDESRKVVSVVDRQLLLYRKYATVPWPWEDLIAEADDRGEAFADA
ncbi:hypothetical protein [Cellulomonas bogoriensis]|uniref:Uncharacterized protein n=1 Tax=Cellulomonas bogoriensis 69B4 = DSM 16987 TaxID=1386082 RepID=A0A0A0C179_9CELL|nr:hypothetical protein [Cellulomonas bogoriensis]KGM13971.1 hypothetical protein N869_06830 [Cellulomonas bogoriensis 69B4 = DSM 16987]